MSMALNAQQLSENAAHTLHTTGLRLRMVVKDTVHGFVELLHNGFALVGLLVALALVVAASRADLRVQGEQQLADWLQQRVQQSAGMNVEPDAIERATAAHLKSLPKAQAAVAMWLATKYRVAPEPIAALVTEAHDLAKSTGLDANLILAIAAIESGFNPFAQSPVGAQGLMQVMTGVHADKYQHFGGKLAAFDPVTNLRVGVKVLQECIQRAGSVDAGLKFYVGSALHDTDNGYAAKVYAEQNRLRDVAAGRLVPFMVTGNAATIATSNGSRAERMLDIGELQTIATPMPPTPSLEKATPDPVTLNKL
jgi:soluble lytic murein transglycosylase-like protein